MSVQRCNKHSREGKEEKLCCPSEALRTPRPVGLVEGGGDGMGREARMTGDSPAKVIGMGMDNQQLGTLMVARSIFFSKTMLTAGDEDWHCPPSDWLLRR